MDAGPMGLTHFQLTCRSFHPSIRALTLLLLCLPQPQAKESPAQPSQPSPVYKTALTSKEPRQVYRTKVPSLPTVFAELLCPESRNPVIPHLFLPGPFTLKFSHLRPSSSPFPFTITNLYTLAVCLVASSPIAPFSLPSPCRVNRQRRTSLGLTAIHSFHHLISSSSPCNLDHTIRIPATNSPPTIPTYGCISLTKYRSPDSFFPPRCPVSPFIESLYPKLTGTTLRTRPSFDSRLPTWDCPCVVNRAGPRPSPLIHLQFSRGSPETTVVPSVGNPEISRVATFRLAFLLLRSHDSLATQLSYLDPDFAS